MTSPSPTCRRRVQNRVLAALVLFVMLPVLLLAPVLARGMIVIHSHGQDGSHVHAVARTSNAASLEAPSALHFHAHLSHPNGVAVDSRDDYPSSGVFLDQQILTLASRAQVNPVTDLSSFHQPPPLTPHGSTFASAPEPRVTRAHALAHGCREPRRDRSIATLLRANHALRF